MGKDESPILAVQVVAQQKRGDTRIYLRKSAAKFHLKKALAISRYG
jgi:hypothetical protein